MTVMAYVIGALLRFLFTIPGLTVALAVHERMLAFVVFLLLAVLAEQGHHGHVRPAAGRQDGVPIRRVPVRTAP